MATPKDIVASILSAQDGFERGEAGSRERLIGQAYKLIAALELPSEAIQRMGWAEPARLAHCKMAVDLKIFETLEKRGQEGIDAASLASEAHANQTLISRMMKHLSAMNVVGETASGKFVSTSLTTALTESRFSDGITYVNGVAGPSFRSMPDYFKEIKYQHPTSLTDGPFQFAHGTKSPFFAWLGENPEYLTVFNNYMSAYRAGKPSWSDRGFYPVLDNLVLSFRKDQSPVLLVDVGGGLGHDLAEFKTKHPDLPGDLVLQDRPEVIATVPATTTEICEAMDHDFFNPQPIRHAHAYYLHSVLHDWSDEDCIKILKNLIPAMQPGYSKILINEIVVPDIGADWSATSMDWLMMALGAMRERTRSTWERIVQQAGLRIAKIYTYELSTESVIEAVLP